MAKTIRRKRYTPAWLFGESEWRLDDATGEWVRVEFELEGDAKAAKLRWWREDKSCWWGARPPKPYRNELEEQHRARARDELIRWLKDPEHPVQILRKPRLGYWD